MSSAAAMREKLYREINVISNEYRKKTRDMYEEFNKNKAFTLQAIEKEYITEVMNLEGQESKLIELRKNFEATKYKALNKVEDEYIKNRYKMEKEGIQMIKTLKEAAIAI